MTNAKHYSAASQAFRVSDLPEDVDLVEIMRAANAEFGETVPPCWIVSHADPFPSLTVGLRGEVGAVLWDDGFDALVPVGGANQEPVDYFLGGRDHAPFPPHTELPVERVLEAVREYTRTGQRPTCVEWIVEADVFPDSDQ